MQSKLSYLGAAILLSLYSNFALAGITPVPSVPEPDTIALLAGGAAAFAIVQRWRNRRK